MSTPPEPAVLFKDQHPRDLAPHKLATKSAIPRLVASCRLQSRPAALLGGRAVRPSPCLLLPRHRREPRLALRRSCLGFCRAHVQAELRGRFVELEWQQRARYADAMRPSATPSLWARPSGDEITRRNRYLNIDPFSSNRVRLKVPTGHDDYINASPILLRGSRSGAQQKFIATQGPKDTSVGHFWRMVWHETGETGVIVMLTQTHEGIREKCFQYYPADGSDGVLDTNADDEFRDQFRVRVELLETSYDEDSRSTVTKLRLTVGEQTKTVWHFLFVGWPDFGIPEAQDRLALLELTKRSEAKTREGLSGSRERSRGGGSASDASPRVVHCSAGVGRSGTFIAIDFLMKELEDGAFDVVDAEEDPISDLVDELRKQRMMMVQGESQFYFLYDLVKQKWLERNSGPRPAPG